MNLRYEIVKECDRAVIENKYHKTSEEFNPFNRMDYHGYDYDTSTGISDEEIDKVLSLEVADETIVERHHWP